MYLATKRDTFNNTDDSSFDKDIPDADIKKTIQHHFKLKKHAWKTHWLCVGKETLINVRPCTITRQGHSVFCKSCKICLLEEKLSLC